MEDKREADGELVFLPGRLMESCEDDMALAREVLQDFLEAAPLHMSRLAAAVAAADLAGLRLEAHSLKGVCRTIGAEALAASGARLEAAGALRDLSDVPVLFAEAARGMNRLGAVLTGYLAAC